MSDTDKLYQLRLLVERAYWTLDAKDHEEANAIYDRHGFWGTLSRDEAESALARFTAALDTIAADVL